MTLALLLAVMAQASPSALGQVFIASKTGTLKGKALNTQKFLFKSAEVTCSGATVKGLIEESELEATYSKDKVAFTGCKFGETAVTISEAAYEFDAEDLLATDSSFTLTDSTLGCSIKVLEAEIPISTVKYVNGSSGLEIESAVKELSYEPSGGLCGSAKLETGAHYEGHLSLELEGGTLTWGKGAAEVKAANGVIEFTAGQAMSTKVVEFTFNVGVNVKTLSVDNRGTGIKFSIVPGTDNCSEKLVTPPATCTVEVEFKSTAVGRFDADLDAPYRRQSSGEPGVVTVLLLRPM